MLFSELPEWIQQILRDLSREGYTYIGRTGAGLSHAFRKGPDKRTASCSPFLRGLNDGPLTECMRLGTIKAIEETAQYHELAYKLILEQIAILGPKYVTYEKIQEICDNNVIIKALRSET